LLESLYANQFEVLLSPSLLLIRVGTADGRELVPGFRQIPSFGTHERTACATQAFGRRQVRNRRGVRVGQPSIDRQTCRPLLSCV
jgi:hypothetical protein